MKKIIWKFLRFFDPSQPVLYDPNTNTFLHVKFAQDNGMVCSGFCQYYFDSINTIERQLLSYDYIWNCQRVGAVDKFPKAILCESVGAWKVTS